jgi:hypothetical protein
MTLKKKTNFYLNLKDYSILKANEKTKLTKKT